MDASPFVPDTRSLKALREAAAECRGCPLHGPATQTVFGEGPRRATLMLVGEMPAAIRWVSSFEPKIPGTGRLVTRNARRHVIERAGIDARRRIC